MTSTLRISLFFALALMVAACNRSSGASGAVPASLVAEAHGKAAFVEFWAPG